MVFFLLILSLLAYGGLLLYGRKLSVNLETIKKEISLLDEKRVPENEDAIVAFDTKLTILKDVFNNHTYWSNFFAKFEDLTIPEAFFPDAKFSLGAEGVTVTLKAATKTYTNLAQQMLAFQQDPSVNQVDITDISLNEEGGIEFGLTLIFPAKVLLTNNVTEKK